MPNLLYTYILSIHDLVWLSFMAFKHCMSLNAKSFLYIYIYILEVYDLIWLGLMAYLPFI